MTEHERTIIAAAKAAAKRRNITFTGFINLTEYPTYKDSKTYLWPYDVLPTLNAAAEDAVEYGNNYVCTIMIDNGTSEVLDLTVHGEKLRREREADELAEQQHRRGLNEWSYR